MHDLEIWHRLAEALDERDIAALDELSALPIAVRAPWLHRVARWLSDPRASVRAAAVRAIGGARGIAGVRAIVAALDDEDQSVRHAAVAALRKTADEAPSRWAHAIFHPRADVRAAALAIEPPTAVAHYGVYLRADPDPANAAAARQARWPRESLRLALDLFERETIDADEASVAIARVPAPELRLVLKASTRRTGEDMREILHAIAQGTTLPAIGGHDVLDRVLDIIALASASGEALTRTLATAVLGQRERDLRRRCAVAVLHALGRHPPDPATLALATVCLPAIAVCRCIPRALRRAGVEGFGRHRAHTGRVDAAIVDAMLDGDLVRDEAGALDLTVIAIAGGLVADKRVSALTDRFGATPLVDAALGDDAGWLAMCEAPDGPAEWILEQITRFHRDRAAPLWAIALGAFAGSGAAKRYESAIARLPREHAADVLWALADARRPAPGSATARVAEDVAKKIRTGDATELLRRWIATRPCPPTEHALGVMMHVGRRLPGDRIGAEVRAWPDAAILDLIRLADTHRLLRHDKELAIAGALVDHPHESIRTWASALVAAGAMVAAVVDRTDSTVRVLTETEAQRIVDCAASELPRALAPALAAPVIGVARALVDRAAPAPDIAACIALIGSADDPALVAEALAKYWHDDELFVMRVRERVVAVWQGQRDLGPFGHAWLHRFEAHAFAWLGWIEAAEGLAHVLDRALAYASKVVTAAMWEAAASVVVLLRYRDPARLRSLLDPSLVALVDEHLDRELGVYAAKMLVALVHVAPEMVTGVVARLRERVPDMDRDTRLEIGRILRIDGMPDRTIAGRRSLPNAAPEEIVRVRSLDDLDALERICEGDQPRLVQEAVVRLVEIGAHGQRRLASMLDTPSRLPADSVRAILESIALWSDSDALASMRARFFASEGLDIAQRFRLAIAFAERGEAQWPDRALQVAAEPCEIQWFSRHDWLALVRFIDDLPRLAATLAPSDQATAYHFAIAYLLGYPPDAACAAAMRAFLDRGTSRPTDLRHAVARRLYADGDPYGLPLVVAAAFDPEVTALDFLFSGVCPADEIVEILLDAAAIAGNRACSEKRVLQLIELRGVPWSVRRRALARLLVEATDPAVRSRVVELIGPSMRREAKLRAVARVFAWGVRRGRELTGRLFRVHMTTRRGELGYTRFAANRIFVSPLPLLMGERDGRDVVEGLVLHEIGHHVYHNGEGAPDVWRRAHAESLHSLLNLVADEHLERNLRAMEAGFGDRLKRLAAYAFQHAEREIAVHRLLDLLLGAALPVLSARPLAVAFDEQSVVVQRGFLLHMLERCGHPFARFVRALRMGLGDRHGDPLLRRALALFGGGFRHLDMAGLYEVAQQLAQLYGGAAALAEAFGGHEGLEFDERESSIHGDGINDDEIQREVDRILDPRQLQSTRGEGPPRRLAVNVNPDAAFDRITHVERVPPDPGAHRAVAQEVRRPADRLREIMRRLGLAMVPQRARLRGRAFDRTRTQAVVLRRDPRMLVAREVKIDSDLFIGVVTDCSGSMQVGTSMVKAHRFGVLIAEAVRQLPGVDARFFGFTDTVIYDAGDAKSCAVTSLRPGGGNNDAAALLHAAKVAAASRRRAKLLVMISDGLPTECSVAALRALVDDLGRRHRICCAQVAVRPLEEIAFAHHVVIAQDDIEASTRRFGEVVSRLVGRTLGR